MQEHSQEEYEIHIERRNTQIWVDQPRGRVTPESFGITLNLELDWRQGPSKGVKWMSFKMPLLKFYHAYQAINNPNIDLEAVLEIARLGGSVVKGLIINKEQLSLEEQDRLSRDEDIHIQALFRSLHNWPLLPGESWSTPEDPILSFTYHLLDTEGITYEEAAAFASTALNKPIKRSAWRMRLARWAEAQGLPPPGPRIGRPSQKR